MARKKYFALGAKPLKVMTWLVTGVGVGRTGDGGNRVQGSGGELADETGQRFGEHPQMIAEDALGAGRNNIAGYVESDRIAMAIGHDHRRGAAAVQVDAVITFETNQPVGRFRINRAIA